MAAPRYACFRLWFLTFPCLFSLLLPVTAATLTVPDQYKTIQAAINASHNGDTVLISVGVYTGPGNVDLSFGGRRITVQSQNGPSATIIDCGGSSSANHRGFFLHNGENGAAIRGLTIMNGYESGTPVNSYGGAVAIAGGSKATLTNCTLSGNKASYGGGVYNDGTLAMTNCTVTGNTAEEGGGVKNDGKGKLTLTACAVMGNTSNETGGGISNSRPGTTTLINCTVAGNTADFGGGVENEANGGTMILTNCTVTKNSAIFGSGVFNGGYIFVLTNCIVTGDSARRYGGGEVEGVFVKANHCDIEGDSRGTLSSLGDWSGGYKGMGNINARPLFVNVRAPYDLHLQAGSPCLGKGLPSGAPRTDKDGRTRPKPPSMGAYEGPDAKAASTLFR